MLPINSPSRRVLVLSANPTLFEESLAHMLTMQADLLVSQQVYLGVTGVLPIVLRDEPDVILVTESTGFEIAELLATLQNAVATNQHCPCLVCVRLEDTRVDLYEPTLQRGGTYQHQRFVVTNRYEFFQILHGESSQMSSSIPISVTI